MKARIANQLMREIARWFYTTPSAQTGVEERQVAQAIAGYMVDDVGMQLDEARESAKEFLNFCADRAWLLGSEGTNEKNQRLYSFTHRTFFEFFAAEAFAREAESSPSRVALLIKDAFEKDSTSVLPELLIQSYHSVKARGATHVFEELCKQASPQTPTLLLLRLLDGAVLARYALIAGFKTLTDRWCTSDDGITRSEFLALMSVNSVARSLFIDEFLLASDGQRVRRVFFPAWASYQLLGKRSYEETWAEAIEAVLIQYAQELSTDSDESVLNWLLIKRKEAAKPDSAWQYVHTIGTFGDVGGFVHWCITRGQFASPTKAQLSAIDEVHSLIKAGKQVPRWVLDMPLLLPSGKLNWSEDSTEVESKLRDILAVLLLAAHEEKLEDGELDAAAQCWPGAIRLVAGYRDWKHEVGSPLSADEKKEALKVISVLPALVQKWTKGGRYLLEDSRLN